MNWISVKDLLPEEGKWILIGKKGFVECGVYSQKEFYQPATGMIRPNITHWMPLPEVPDELG